MKARLVYRTDIDKKVLEEMDLKQLDQFVYSNFENSNAVISSDRYKEELKGMSIDGDVYIGYCPVDLPFTDLYYYTLDGVNLTEEQMLEPYFGEHPQVPDQKKFVQDIQILLKNGENVFRFFENFFGAFSDDEKLAYQQGKISGNASFCLGGINRFISEVSRGNEGYFFTRLIRDNILCGEYQKGGDFSIYDSCSRGAYLKK